MSEDSSSARAHVLRLPATLAGLDDATGSLRRLLDSRPLPAPARHNIELAFEEVVANIVRHGLAATDIEVAVSFGRDETVLTFSDNGVPFDPSAHAHPPVPESLEDAPVGGLGIVLVKKVASRMEYERTASHNRLLLVVPAR